jgi:streptogramin lyase
MKAAGTAIAIASLLLLIVALGVTGASLTATLQTALNPSGEAYELNLDAANNLVISDWGADEIWQLNPATNVYTIYHGTSSASDARVDSNGDIWWTEPDSDKVGRYSVANDEITT